MAALQQAYQVTLGQLLTAITAIVLTIGGGWLTLNIKVENIASTQSGEVEKIKIIQQRAIVIDSDRKQENKDQQEYREQTIKLLYEIKVELAKKQDRK